MKKILLGFAAATMLLVAPRPASAFCGFYVSGAGGNLYNNATQVVLMRQGTRTVLSMQNNYQGPPKNFAMVVPVPVVLQEENVKTLPMGIFKRVDKLAAPRLVEYWEQDPCRPMPPRKPMMVTRSAPRRSASRARKPRDLGVTVEAKFSVGEYQIVILSAKDATGLDTWLRQEKYKIPRGAARLLRPYVQSGMKFFVAKVDVSKVRFNGKQAMLSPLRFHYDSTEFSLPVRLGLMNSRGKQDLIVHILAKQRYEVANYKNVAIPTNLDVKNKTRKRFGQFYAALFDRTIRANPGAVVTEYSWSAGSCDPCPTPPLSGGDIMTLGGDVIGGNTMIRTRPGRPVMRPGPPGIRPRPRRPGRRWRRPRRWAGSWTLTRLHARYGKRDMKNDLVFRAAPPIMGGREVRGQGRKLETGVRQGYMNNFQARYAIRHRWTGPIRCDSPRRGVWGGPPGGMHTPKVRPALDLAFIKRRARVRSFVRGRLPRLRNRSHGVVPAKAKP